MYRTHSLDLSFTPRVRTGLRAYADPPTTCPHCGSTQIRATLATEHVQHYLCDACASLWNVAKTRHEDVITDAPDNSRRKK